MTDYTCPAEGCEYGEKGGKSLAAVRSHINASSDGGHDWEQLKPTVKQQGDQQPEATEETFDQETSTDDQPETTDGPDTDDEYQQQVEANTVSVDNGDDDDDKAVSVDPVDDTTEDDAGGSAAVTLVTASVALALVVLLVRGNDQNDETTAQDLDDDTADAFEGWDDE